MKDNDPVKALSEGRSLTVGRVEAINHGGGVRRLWFRSHVLCTHEEHKNTLTFYQPGDHLTEAEAGWINRVLKEFNRPIRLHVEDGKTFLLDFKAGSIECWQGHLSIPAGRLPRAVA